MLPKIFLMASCLCLASRIVIGAPSNREENGNFAKPSDPESSRLGSSNKVDNMLSTVHIDQKTTTIDHQSRWPLSTIQNLRVGSLNNSRTHQPTTTSFANIVLDSRILDGLGGLLADEIINYDEHGQQTFMANGRESRRFGPVRSLGSLWNKPKVSPLYLINGTVCRFVNANPICTTLSTQGLLPAASSTPRSAAINSGTATNGGSSVVFASQNQAPPIRPAAIVDEETGTVNIEEVSQSEAINQQQRNQLALAQSVPANKPQQYAASSLSTGASIGAPRPINSIGRRTLNLLSLKRPIRQQTIY